MTTNVITISITMIYVLGGLGLLAGRALGSEQRSVFQEGSLRGGGSCKERGQQDTRVKRTPHHPLLVGGLGLLAEQRNTSLIMSLLGRLRLGWLKLP